MKLQNSYIFLINPNKSRNDITKTNETDVIHIDIGPTIIDYIRKSFPCTTKNNDQDWYFRSKLHWVYHKGKILCNVEFHIEEVVDITYLDIVVEGQTKSQIVACLEQIQQALQNSGIQDNYIMVISYDAVSEYYCNKIYPKLNNLERNIRKLLFNIYIVNFGKDYYKATVSEELQSKIKGVIRPKGNQKQKETTVIQEFFYSFDFSDIQNLLFVPKWTKIDENAKRKFLESNKDLTLLSDEVLRATFETFEPKSDWDRFFSSKITGIDFQNIINTIRIYRNTVAHCKFFYRDNYHDCYHAINRLNNAILLAIKLTEEDDFAQKNSAALQETMAGMKEAFAKYTATIAELAQQISQSLHSTISNALVELSRSVCSALDPDIEEE